LADYELVRKEVAAELDIRASILDKLVAKERPPEDAAPGQGRPLELPSPEPWPDPVDGKELISELTTLIRRYVVLTPNDALIIAL
jgi:putative DNA primase/helicase